ncbi:type I-U CRISPR-associated RAMP protein Csb1/Cas7u [Streptomyces xiamenensis]|uniref:type I-G CRISPR-associated RAMP protein Csb1/Cas7g n=1 Tax=Streptomyces xiamenensis TaxID=408015 RepID=UPI0036EE4AE8
MNQPKGATVIDTTANRLRFSATLEPALGSRFQPTGFPDLGAAEFTSYNDKGEPVASLLVESVQSVANRLEATAWDPAAQTPQAFLADLPHVEVRAADDQRFLTSSRLEAHRLASAFVRDSTHDGRPMLEHITERLGLVNHKPLHHQSMAAALMSLDPFSLLHGCFFNQAAWFGQPRFARAVSGVIEAHGVEQAVSGGRKSDTVQHKNTKSSDDDTETTKGSAEGYGSIPFHRIEYTARTITADFTIDTQLLRSYNLPDPTTELLTALALWEIRVFLRDGLRLRTACDLDLLHVESRTGHELPDADTLATRITELMPSATAHLTHTGPLTVHWADGKTAKSTKGSKKTAKKTAAPTQRTAADQASLTDTEVTAP